MPGLDFQSALQQAFTQFGPWAYLGLFLAVFIQTANPVGVVVPGNPLVFACGLFARSSGVVALEALLLTLAVGAVGGAFVGYAIGRGVGGPLLAKPRYAKMQARLDAFFERHGPKAVAVSYFVPFVRCFVPTVAGATLLPMREFFGAALVGGCLWVGLFGGAGYLLGTIPMVRQNLELATIALGVVLLAQAVIKAQRASKRSSESTL